MSSARRAASPGAVSSAPGLARHVRSTDSASAECKYLPLWSDGVWRKPPGGEAQMAAHRICGDLQQLHLKSFTQCLQGLRRRTSACYLRPQRDTTCRPGGRQGPTRLATTRAIGPPRPRPLVTSVGKRALIGCREGAGKRFWEGGRFSKCSDPCQLEPLAPLARGGRE